MSARRRLFAGRLEGDFLADPPKYRLEGNLRKINLHDLLAGTSDLGELLTGLAGADVVLEAAGTRARQFVRSLEGLIVGVLRDGEMQRVNLLAAMAAASSPEQSGDPVGGVTRLQSLGGDFRIAGRQVELDQVRAIVTGAALELTGRVGFDGRMDLQLSGQPLLVEGRKPSPADKRLLALTYRLSGAWVSTCVKRQRGEESSDACCSNTNPTLPSPVTVTGEAAAAPVLAGSAVVVSRRKTCSTR